VLMPLSLGCWWLAPILVRDRALLEVGPCPVCFSANSAAGGWFQPRCSLGPAARALAAIFLFPILTAALSPWWADPESFRVTPGRSPPNRPACRPACLFSPLLVLLALQRSTCSILILGQAALRARSALTRRPQPGSPPGPRSRLASIKPSATLSVALRTCLDSPPQRGHSWFRGPVRTQVLCARPLACLRPA